MGKKMNNAPVYYALAQVRFNPLAAVETFIPEIQDSLRRTGYPDYEPVQITQFMVSPSQVAKSLVTSRYHFLNSTRTAGFILDQSWLSYQTTDYDTSEPFDAAFLEGLRILHKEATLSYSQRIGVRYLDAVCPGPDETPSKYLQASVMGLAESLEGRRLEHSVSETRTTLGKNTLVSRAIIHQQEEEGAAFTEDLQPVPLRLTDKFAKIKGTYAIIDTDTFITDRQEFDLSNLENTLLSLHNEIRRSFELMVTPYALKVWK